MEAALAPIVAGWMLDEPRECVVCHRLWQRERSHAAWRLAPLTDPGRPPADEGPDRLADAD